MKYCDRNILLNHLLNHFQFYKFLRYVTSNYATAPTRTNNSSEPAARTPDWSQFLWRGFNRCHGPIAKTVRCGHSPVEAQHWSTWWMSDRNQSSRGFIPALNSCMGRPVRGEKRCGQCSCCLSGLHPSFFLYLLLFILPLLLEVASCRGSTNNICRRDEWMQLVGVFFPPLLPALGRIMIGYPVSSLWAFTQFNLPKPLPFFEKNCCVFNLIRWAGILYFYWNWAVLHCDKCTEVIGQKTNLKTNQTFFILC